MLLINLSRMRLSVIVAAIEKIFGSSNSDFSGEWEFFVVAGNFCYQVLVTTGLF